MTMETETRQQRAGSTNPFRVLETESQLAKRWAISSRTLQMWRFKGSGGPPYFPMARAIVGGLAFSTIITLMVLPTVYVLIDDLRNWTNRISATAK